MVSGSEPRNRRMALIVAEGDFRKAFAPVALRDHLSLRIPVNADSDSDRLRTAIPIDRGQRSGDRGQ
jgi:hypothetical protein